MKMPVNVLGERLQMCSDSPKTGYLRSGKCETGPQDHGSHVICAQVTEAFLAFTKSMGNDLSTPIPAYVRAWGRISIIKYKQKLKWIITGKNLQLAVKTAASSFTYRHVKEHRPGKSVFPTALIVAMDGKNG